MWPETIDTVEQLEDLLSRPGAAAVDALRRIPGDVVVLGAGGKMGPTLARMLRRAAEEAGKPRRIIAVSRFQDAELRRRFEQWGIKTIAGDLSDRMFVNALPDAPNVFFMAGMKFGATGREPLTWGMNAYVPALTCERYRGHRIVAFSTGNVYGLVPVAGGGSKETDPLSPVGEYAMSCLARERIFQYFCERDGTPVTIIRLNYAVEPRYGVLVDLAGHIQRGEPVDVSMGYVNVIWQGDASDAIIAALSDASVPARVLNVTGREILRVRELAEKLAALLGRTVTCTGKEEDDALLSNASECHQRYGPPRVPIERLLTWTADWLQRGRPILDKPTKFEVRSGRF